MFNSKVKDLVLSTLVADSYCLGSHWIYDETQLKSIKIDWDSLNSACAIWHKGKSVGEFTHYGDQNYYLYQYSLENDSFELSSYMNFWQKKMSIYNGYIDGSTRETLANLENNKELPCGSHSSDLSVISKIPSLLALSENKEEFLQNVELTVRATHDSIQAIEASRFFALLLIEVLNGADILDSILNLKDKFSTTIQSHINKGIKSTDEDTFETIREFGPACGIDEGFAGVIHLLCKYNNFKEAMINNAKAGGDNSARAMIVAMILTAKNGSQKIPPQWTNIKVQL